MSAMPDDAPALRPAWRAAMCGGLIGLTEMALVLAPLAMHTPVWQWTSEFTGSGFGGAYRTLLAFVFLLLAALISGLVVGRGLFRPRRSASSMWGIMLVFQVLNGAVCFGIFTLFYLLWPR